MILPLNDAPTVGGYSSTITEDALGNRWIDLFDLEIDDVDSFSGALLVHFEWTNANNDFVWMPNGKVWYNASATSFDLVGRLDDILDVLYGAQFAFFSSATVPDTLTVLAEDNGNSGYDSPFPLARRRSASTAYLLNLTTATNWSLPMPTFVDPFPAIPLLISTAYIFGQDYTNLPIGLQVLTTQGGSPNVQLVLVAGYGNISERTGDHANNARGWHRRHC